jgi:hypothetical protein
MAKWKIVHLQSGKYQVWRKTAVGWVDICERETEESAKNFINNKK